MKGEDYMMVTLMLFTTAVYAYQLTRPVEAREYCARPPHMITTQDCNRVPTLAIPYCPFPN